MSPSAIRKSAPKSVIMLQAEPENRRLYQLAPMKPTLHLGPAHLRTGYCGCPATEVLAGGAKLVFSEVADRLKIPEKARDEAIRAAEALLDSVVRAIKPHATAKEAEAILNTFSMEFTAGIKNGDFGTAKVEVAFKVSRSGLDVLPLELRNTVYKSLTFVLPEEERKQFEENFANQHYLYKVRNFRFVINPANYIQTGDWKARISTIFGYDPYATNKRVAGRTLSVQPLATFSRTASGSIGVSLLVEGSVPLARDPGIYEEANKFSSIIAPNAGGGDYRFPSSLSN